MGWGGPTTMAAMAMTPQLKAELTTIPVVKPCCRRTEVAALLRIAGSLHLAGGRLEIEADLDSGGVARRLRTAIQEVFGLSSSLAVVNASGIRRASRYVVRIGADGQALARQTGLIDNHGRPVRGMPASVVGASRCCQVAAWRGAVLARGSLTEPGRSMSLEVTCPNGESALALVGAARRLEIASKWREVRGVDRVVLRDGEAIADMLTRMGAHDTRMAWEERRMRREVRASANRLANFDDANLRRSAQAAVAA